MPQPRFADVHVKRAIQNVAIGYQNPAFIAEQIFPTVPVDNQSDKYYTFDRGDMFRDQAENDRQPGSRAPRVGWNLSNDEYACKRISLAQGVPDMTVENADEVVRPFERATANVMRQVLIRRERRLAADMFTTGVWGTDKTGTTDFSKWSDFANSDPAKDILVAKDAVSLEIGVEPNLLVIGQDVLRSLRLHPDAIDRFKYTRVGIIGAAEIAQWLDVPRVLVGGAPYNSAAEGQTVSMARIWGQNALLMYVTDAPAIDEPSAGYTYQWQPVSTKVFREEAEEQDVTEANVNIDMKVTSSISGYFFSDCVD
jgi:hypothetical protein